MPFVRAIRFRGDRYRDISSFVRNEWPFTRIPKAVTFAEQSCGYYEFVPANDYHDRRSDGKYGTARADVVRNLKKRQNALTLRSPGVWVDPSLPRGRERFREFETAANRTVLSLPVRIRVHPDQRVRYAFLRVDIRGGGRKMLGRRVIYVVFR